MDKKSILSLTDEQIGKMFRTLYAEHEDFVIATSGMGTDLPLTLEAGSWALSRPYR